MIIRRGLVLLLLLLGACAKQPRAQSVTVPAGTPASSFAPAAPVEGTISGGGGTGIRCNGQLELLDVFEARRDGLDLIKAPQSKLDAVNELSARFARHFWNPETIPMADYVASLANQLIAPILEGRNFTTDDKIDRVRFVEQIDPTNDYGNVQWPKGCRPEQIAFFSDSTGELSIVRAAWDELDWLSRMALVIHELIYMQERRVGMKGLLAKVRLNDSASTRAFVGRLLSTRPLPTKSEGLPFSSNLWRCENVGAAREPERATYLYAFDSGGRLTLNFKSLMGRQDVFQMRADFKTLTLASVLAKDAGSVSESAPLVLVGDAANPEFVITVSKTADGEIDLAVVHGSRAKGPAAKLSCEKL